MIQIFNAIIVFAVGFAIGFFGMNMAIERQNQK